MYLAGVFAVEPQSGKNYKMSTRCHAHEACLGGQDVVGRTPTDRGRKATKVSMLTNELGTPLTLCFHRGNKSDMLTLKHLIDTCKRKTETSGRTATVNAHRNAPARPVDPCRKVALSLFNASPESARTSSQGALQIVKPKRKGQTRTRGENCKESKRRRRKLSGGSGRTGRPQSRRRTQTTRISGDSWQNYTKRDWTR